MGTTGKDVLWNQDGTLYHLGVKHGDVFPRMIQVGAYRRAAVIAEELTETKTFKCDRGFHIYSGMYKGVGISVVATGMGAPMMDFFVREVSTILPQKLAIIRIGTCGIIDPDVACGTLINCDGAAYVYRNYAHFDGGAVNWNEAINGPPYIISIPVAAYAPLVESLHKAVLAIRSNEECCRLVAASGESFYSTQGRQLDHFDDKNGELMDELRKAGVGCIEMEVHQLFHLAHHRKTECYAAALLIGVLNRVCKDSENLAAEKLKLAEKEAGLASLNTLALFKL